MENNRQFYRGDVYYVQSVFGKREGGEPTARPALIVSNNKANRNSKNVTVCYIGKPDDKEYPFHVNIDKYRTILCETVTTVQKSRLINLMTVIPRATMKRVDDAIKIHLSLNTEEVGGLY